jgi:hypothetical protein
MSADKRTVTTDALETLGTIIGDGEKRDAIHLAVENVVAGERLSPGEHINLRDGKAYATAGGKNVGIVDPFLQCHVNAGDRFWLVVYPRQIKSLRHVWEHPDFPASVETQVQVVASPEAESKAWIETFATELDQTYSRLMEAARKWIEESDWTYDNSETYKEVDYAKWPIFWKHFEIVTGQKVVNHDDTFFTCSC